MDTPDLAPLRSIVGALHRGSVTCALGGSGLLVAMGLSPRARDWDLTTDDDLERVCHALASFSPRMEGPQDIHADHKLILEGGLVEVIVGFSMRSGESIVRLPTRVTGAFEGIPLGSPEVWAVAYALLGSDAKSEMLFDWLARNGADRVVVARMLEEPVPLEVERRLRGLAGRGPAGVRGTSV